MKPPDRTDVSSKTPGRRLTPVGPAAPFDIAFFAPDLPASDGVSSARASGGPDFATAAMARALARYGHAVALLCDTDQCSSAESVSLVPASDFPGCLAGRDLDVFVSCGADEDLGDAVDANVIGLWHRRPFGEIDRRRAARPSGGGSSASRSIRTTGRVSWTSSASCTASCRCRRSRRRFSSRTKKPTCGAAWRASRRSWTRSSSETPDPPTGRSTSAVGRRGHELRRG